MKRSSIKTTLVPAFFAYSIAFASLATAHSSPVVWTAPSLHRVGMSDPAGKGSEVNISAARDEYQSFQIVVNGASNGLSKVDVKVSDLEGPSGQVIPRTSFTLYREKYVFVSSSRLLTRRPASHSQVQLSQQRLSMSRPGTISLSGWTCWSRRLLRLVNIPARTR
jgi:hypothetical protein